MTDIDNLRHLADLQNRAYELEAHWLQHLLTLAAGALTLLTVFAATDPASDMARYNLAAVWVLLGAGIVSGTGATYLAVDRANRLRDRFREELKSALAEGRTIQTVSTNPAKWLEQCKSVMAISLLLAVVSLVSYSVLTTLA